MARVVAFIPDLLFGSRVQAGLTAIGQEVELVCTAESTRDALDDADLLVVDLTDEVVTRTDLARSLLADGSLDGVRTLAFYSHVDTDARCIAESAGFDLVVPRSRMAREGNELVAQLVEEETDVSGSAG